MPPCNDDLIHVGASSCPPGVQGLDGFLEALRVGKGEQGLP